MQAEGPNEFDRWLVRQGLGHHVDTLAGHGVDCDTVAAWPDSQLSALGFAPDDIDALRAALRRRGPAAAATSASPGARGERRQITVMFCDLVDWSSWADRLDPEDLTRLTQAYYDLCCRRIESFGGYNARLEGDGVLAYFGYPKAREDAVECAIRASLDIIAAMGRERLLREYRFQVRIGLATGLAVVTDIVGEGYSASSVVMGRTPNLARRVQTLAEPGTVYVVHETSRRAGGLFDYADQGVHVFKGFDEPTRVWRVLRESRDDERFHALRVKTHACVGRDRQLEVLKTSWQRTHAGQGQVLSVVGEAGIGKSRLLHAAVDELSPAPGRVITWQCSPSRRGTPLSPIIGCLLRESGASRSDAADNRHRLETWLGGSSSELDVPLLAELLAVPLPGPIEPLVLAPDRRRDLTREILARHLERLAAATPVLLLVEDAHWMDGATRDLIEMLLRRVRDLPVMTLITTRPEPRHAWQGGAGCEELLLESLDSADAEQIVRHVCQGRDLPGPVLREILERADGIPLYIEELTAAVLESDLPERSDSAWDQAGAFQDLGVPATLHDSLNARLDHLGEVKLVARAASAIGREFSFRLLHHVMELPADRLQAALDRLVQAQLLFRRGVGAEADADYSFKHALVQMAAYDGQLRSDRQTLHARIVTAIEQHEPEVARHEPGLMAHHCQLAGMRDREVDYLYAAGLMSTRMVAIREALAAFERAEALLDEVDDPTRHDERHIAVLLGMMEAGRFAILPDRLLALSDKARSLSTRHGLQRDANTLASILFQDGRARVYTSRYAEARQIFQQIRELGLASGSTRLERKPASAFSMTLCCQGLFDETLAFIHEGNIDYYKETGSFIDFLSGLGWIGYACCEAGGGDDGLRHADRSVREAEQMQSPIYVAGAYIWRSHALMALRRLDEAVHDARQTYEIAASHAVPYLVWHALVFLSLCQCRQGDFDAASATLQQARALLAKEAGGTWSLLDYLPAIEAEIACFRSQHPEALRKADEALAVAVPVGGHFTEAMAWSVKAISGLRLGGDLAQAQSCFDRARAIHERGGARAEACFGALVWAHALAETGHDESARRWLRHARAMAARHGFVLERCEHGAAAVLEIASHP